MNQTVAPKVNPKPAEVAIAGHFGEFVQGRVSAAGPVGLVTVPCPALVTRLRFEPCLGTPLTANEPAEKAIKAAGLTLSHLGCQGVGGSLTVSRPAPVGHGAGSSTAETLAAVRAIAQSFANTLAPEIEAQLCLSAEGAIDPLMFDQHPLMFASRQGKILRDLPALPPMQIVGGFCGAPQPTDPHDDQFADMSAAFVRLEQALKENDLAAVGAAATASAKANQFRNPNPMWLDVLKLSTEVNAAGVVVAHTGTAIGLIVEIGHNCTQLARELGRLGATRVLCFEPGNYSPRRTLPKE